MRQDAVVPGEVAQWSGALLLSREPASIPSTHMTAQSVTLVSGDLMPSFGLHGYQASIWCTDTHRQTHPFT